MSTVVVGAGLAGVRTVQALRRRGHDAPITMLGAETHIPYDRPPLSKEFLLGKLGEDDLRLVDTGVLDGLDVQLRLGTRATALDLHRRQVLAGSELVPFETLVIACGSAPRMLPGVGPLDGVHPLRTIDDALAIRAAFAAEARVAVVGGGFIGVEVASAARLLGLDVTIIDPLPALMMRGVGSVVGAALAHRYRDSGVRLRLGRSVSRVEGRERVERLVLDDGEVLEVDVVVVGIGAVPDVGWLASSGLDCTDGVTCDASLRVADGVYVVGDAARFEGPSGHHRREHWTSATEHAAVVADVITGTASSYSKVPYVWSDQLGTRLQIWGELDAGDELHCVHGDLDAEEFVVAFGSDATMRGVIAFGARREAMRAQRLLHAGARWKAGYGPVADAE